MRTTSANFTAAYLRLLHGEEPQPADYPAARDLIDNGYAQGRYQASHARTNPGEVLAMVGFAPTMQGRLYADELAELQRKNTLGYRLRQAAFGTLSFGAGWVFGVFSQVAANLLTKQLGG